MHWGFSSNPYHEELAGRKIKKKNDWDPRLKPYTSLDPDRLKVSGEGAWDAAQYIPDELWMPYVEPQILELDRPVYERGLPNLEAEEKHTVFSLLAKWDQNNLLELHSARTVQPGPEGKVKVFNAHKSLTQDRQIGDRRWRNAYEGKIPGPSKSLPTGSQICRFLVPPGKGVKISIADRSDFYHQMSCSLERSRSNLLWPQMELGEFKGTRAYERFVARAQALPRRIDRTVFGDELHGPLFADRDVSDQCPVFGAFRSVLQGGQLGVEFGIAAHVGSLLEKGALQEEHWMRSDKLPRPNGLFQGLVIDVFFNIAQVPISSLRQRPGSVGNPGLAAFKAAKEIYAEEKLAGSDQKDVIDCSKATAVGAHVDSSYALAKQGIIPVAAPPEKRLALSWILLQAGKMAYTTGDLHSPLVGGGVSAFYFRFFSMAVLDFVFKTVPNEPSSPFEDALFHLPRRHANELALAAAILPVSSSNLLAPVSNQVFASDASQERGAFCSCEAPSDVGSAMWLSGDFKGARSFLQPWPKRFFRECCGTEEEDWEAWSSEFPDAWADDANAQGPKVSRPFAQYFDFIEVCGGSGVLSEEMAKRGFVVGPILDITYSPQYDLTSERVLSWLIFMIQHKRVRALAIKPPCTSFSPAAHPAVRSYSQPRGFCEKNPKVWVGNCLAFGGLTLLWVALHAEVLGLLEAPGKSKMAWLTEWLYMLTLACRDSRSLHGVLRFWKHSPKGEQIFDVQHESRLHCAELQPRS